MAQGEEFLKARLEKDLAELKKMIDSVVSTCIDYKFSMLNNLI